MQKVADLSILTSGIKLVLSSLRQKDTLFEARVEAVQDNCVLISMPYSHGVVMPLSVGSSLECMFVDKDKRYSFKSTVDFFVNERIKKVAITLPMDLIEIDIRAYFRVEVEHLVKVTPYFPDQFFFRKGDLQAFSYYATLVDISGGGAKLYCKNGLPDIEFIDIDLAPIIPELTKVRGRLTRSLDMGNNIFDIGIQFIDLKEFERNQIIKYVFKRQIEIRNSNKGG